MTSKNAPSADFGKAKEEAERLQAEYRRAEEAYRTQRSTMSDEEATRAAGDLRDLLKRTVAATEAMYPFFPQATDSEETIAMKIDAMYAEAAVRHAARRAKAEDEQLAAIDSLMGTDEPPRPRAPGEPEIELTPGMQKAIDEAMETRRWCDEFLRDVEPEGNG